MERTYKTIKSVLKHHIKTGVKSLWTWKDDNFTMIYENYSGDDRIYTSNQLLKILANDTTTIRVLFLICNFCTYNFKYNRKQDKSQKK